MSTKNTEKNKPKKNAQIPFKYPQPIILKAWPNQIKDPSDFENASNNLKIQSNQKIQNNLVTLRIKQFQFEYHDFYIVLPKSTTILSLKFKIAKIQHLDSVSPEEIVIYKTNAKAQEIGNEMSVHAPRRTSILKKIELGKKIQYGDSELVCSDPYETLEDCFKEIEGFSMQNLMQEHIYDIITSDLNSPPQSLKGPFEIGQPVFRHDIQIGRKGFEDLPFPNFIIYYDILNRMPFYNENKYFPLATNSVLGVLQKSNELRDSETNNPLLMYVDLERKERRDLLASNESKKKQDGEGMNIGQSAHLGFGFFLKTKKLAKAAYFTK